MKGRTLAVGNSISEIYSEHRKTARRCRLTNSGALNFHGSHRLSSDWSHDGVPHDGVPHGGRGLNVIHPRLNLRVAIFNVWKVCGTIADGCSVSPNAHTSFISFPSIYWSCFEVKETSCNTIPMELKVTKTTLLTSKIAFPHTLNMNQWVSLNSVNSHWISDTLTDSNLKSTGPQQRTPLSCLHSDY